jgi:hypothetical protein
MRTWNIQNMKHESQPLLCAAHLVSFLPDYFNTLRQLHSLHSLDTEYSSCLLKIEYGRRFGKTRNFVMQGTRLWGILRDSSIYSCGEGRQSVQGKQGRHMLGLMTASPLISASLARNPKPTATPIPARISVLATCWYGECATCGRGPR